MRPDPSLKDRILLFVIDVLFVLFVAGLVIAPFLLPDDPTGPPEARAR